MAADTGRYPVVEYLVLHGKANINQCRTDGISALYISSQRGHHNIVEFLLKQGADPNQSSATTNCTPLMISAGKSNSKCRNVTKNFEKKSWD